MQASCLGRSTVASPLTAWSRSGAPHAARASSRPIARVRAEGALSSGGNRERAIGEDFAHQRCQMSPKSLAPRSGCRTLGRRAGEAIHIGPGPAGAGASLGTQRGQEEGHRACRRCICDETQDLCGSCIILGCRACLQEAEGVPFGVYLIASVLVAIAAVGSGKRRSALHGVGCSNLPRGPASPDVCPCPRPTARSV